MYIKYLKTAYIFFRAVMLRAMAEINISLYFDLSVHYHKYR